MVKARLWRRIILAGCIMLAGPVSCVGTSPHSVVFTPHFQHVQGNLNAFHGGEKQACESTVWWLIKTGDRSVEAAMPSIHPRNGASLAYLTISEVRENYIIWQVACTRINAYFAYVRSPGDTAIEEVAAAKRTQESVWEDPYWKSKCSSLVATLYGAASPKERKRIMLVCQEKCETGSSMALRTCLKNAGSEEDYQKCGRFL